MELPLGAEVNWTPPQQPDGAPLRGSHVMLRPIDAAEDAGPLYAASHPPAGDPAIWTYLFEGPYEGVEDLQRQLERDARSADPRFYAVVPVGDGRPLGVVSYLRIEPQHGSIEIGNIWFAGPLQRTTAATEAIYLLARHAFDDLGYRRLEWKCNALNAASRRAAERFGFTFEGVFRKHQIVKGRNRDTAWHSIVEDEWPTIRSGFEDWLSPDNFTAQGTQKRTLGELISSAAR